jgi:MFS family permease
MRARRPRYSTTLVTLIFAWYDCGDGGKMNRPLRAFDYIAMNVYYLGISFMWNTVGRFLLQAILPRANMVGRDNAEAALGLLSFVGLLIATIVQPAAGAFSDPFTSRWGKRYPFVVGATLVDLIFLAGIAFAPNYWVLLAAYWLLQFSSNIAHGPYQGLLPDLVPEKQRGVASGVKQFIDTSGLIATALIVPRILGDPDTALDTNIQMMVAFVAFVLLGTMMLNVVLVREPATARAPVIDRPREKFSFARALHFVNRFPDFSWLIAARLAILGGLAFISNNAQFYFQKILLGHITDVDAAIKAAVTLQGDLLTTVVLTLVLFTLLAGPLSDRVGRKSVNVIGGLIAMVGAIVLLFARNAPAPFIGINDLLGAGGLIGIGMGFFTSANWAWAVDLTPPEDSARFLGLTNLATAGATVVTSLLAPFISLFNAQSAGSGFTFMFVVGIIGFGLGVVMLFQVKETRGQKG